MIGKWGRSALIGKISDYFNVVCFDLVIGNGVKSFLDGVKNGYFLLGEIPEYSSLFLGKQIDWITSRAERG